MVNDMGRYATGFLQTLRSRLDRDERGMALMEVVVSAAVVALIAVGLLTGFDVAGATSGTNKGRAVAASLAQDDTERMRGVEVRTLILRGPETRTVKAGEVTYTVKSTAEIVTDSVNQGCTTGSGGIDYLKLHSEVTWPGMRIDPVSADTLMAPKPGSFGPDEGGLSVQLVNRDGAPIQGLNVSIAGPGNFSDATDVNGCAFFTYIPAGDYNVSFSQPGKVTPAGVSNVNDPVGVPDGAVSNKIISYDTAARVTASFTTINAGGAEVADRGTAFAAAHTGIPAPGALFFTNGSQIASITTPFMLFPFTSPYSVYAGSCPNARPQLFGQSPRNVLLGPGGSGTANALEPSLDVLVQYSGTAVRDATVRFYDNSCGTVFTYPALTGTEIVTPPSTVIAAGRILYPGMPYGNYDICADYDPPGSTPRRRLELTNINNNDPDRENIIIDIPASSGANGSCPAS
ncbi:MAG: carboxypeptidase-like regulatory domain-containing protein [Thermoleophilaceae bacterium]